MSGYQGYSDEDQERWLQACLGEMDRGAFFSPWEESFLEDLAEREGAFHFTIAQQRKLLQIYRERVLGEE